MDFICFNCKAKENLHNAPQSKEMRRKWQDLIPDAYGTMFESVSFRLCSDHFDSKCFTREGKLSLYAVPTKFIVHNVWFEVEQESCEKSLFDRSGLTDSPFNGDLINILSKINSSPEVSSIDFKFSSIEKSPAKTESASSSLHDNNNSVDDYLDNNSQLITLNNIEFPLIGSSKRLTISDTSFKSPPRKTLKNGGLITAPQIFKNELISPPLNARLDTPVVPPKKTVLFTAPSTSKADLKSLITPVTKHVSSCRIISNEKIDLPPLKQIPSTRKLKVCFVMVKRLKLGNLNQALTNTPNSAKCELQKYQQELKIAMRFNNTLLRQLARSRTKASKLRAFLEELNRNGIISKKDKSNKNTL